ncbi:hypothetical protein ACFLYD_05475 [Chloroflexota bacterium]
MAEIAVAVVQMVPQLGKVEDNFAQLRNNLHRAKSRPDRLSGTGDHWL